MPAAGALSVVEAVAAEAHRGLTSTPRTLSPWLFYDESGSVLFEQITKLPEYYLTRTERLIFQNCADEVLHELDASVTIAELGAGTAAKTGILLRAAARLQPSLLYQPIDVSGSALAEARALEGVISNLTVRPQVANYITDSIHIHRPNNHRILALYIGSSIGNFSPMEARSILTNLRKQLRPADALLLGTDLAPSPRKSVATLIAAYDDAQGVTAAFNRNVLHRLNRDLKTDFYPACFRHVARWNQVHSRIEMHLDPMYPQTVCLPGTNGETSLMLHFTPGQTIHTENSYKFTAVGLQTLLEATGFAPAKTFTDPDGLFAVTLATAI